MKYYIIDDDIGTVKTLEHIVESRGLGEVIGRSVDPEKAINEIACLFPDIVLVDLLMSKMDGIALVSKAKKQRPEISFVMISRVADKSMIEQAYNAGVEFYISKPINVIEVEKVLNNVSEKIRMNSIVTNIKGMFAAEEKPQKEPEDDLKEIHVFLGLLGMLGEKGTADILDICQYLIDNRIGYSKDVLCQVSGAKSEQPKNVEQRIRRAMKKGLTNVAHLGIDDFSNEVFQNYANYVFDFKNIKDEMDYIKGTGTGGGRVNISKFIEGLLLYRKLSE